MNKKQLWNNPNINVIEINGRWFALSGWNGEKYCDCWVTDENTFSLEDGKIYEITPIYQGIGEPNQDGDFEQYEIIAYEIN